MWIEPFRVSVSRWCLGLGGPKYGGGNVAMTTTFNAKGVAHQIPASRIARWVDWFGLEYPEGVSQRGRCLCGTPLGYGFGA